MSTRILAQCIYRYQGPSPRVQGDSKTCSSRVTTDGGVRLAGTRYQPSIFYPVGTGTQLTSLCGDVCSYNRIHTEASSFVSWIRCEQSNTEAHALIVFPHSKGEGWTRPSFLDAWVSFGGSPSCCCEVAHLAAVPFHFTPAASGAAGKKASFIQK